jgi:hypothetical protein
MGNFIYKPGDPGEPGIPYKIKLDENYSNYKHSVTPYWLSTFSCISPVDSKKYNLLIKCATYFPH